MSAHLATIRRGAPAATISLLLPFCRPHCPPYFHGHDSIVSGLNDEYLNPTTLECECVSKLHVYSACRDASDVVGTELALTHVNSSTHGVPFVKNGKAPNVRIFHLIL